MLNKPVYFIMDVDGTLTDGKIYMSPIGEAMKVFCIKDGCGIHDILIPLNITPIVITGRNSEIVSKRCEELGIDRVYQGISKKETVLKEITTDYSKIAFIGDDINDLSCMKIIKEAGGIVGCPSDAVEAVKSEVNFISVHKGGDGAVRDFIEWIVCNCVER